MNDNNKKIEKQLEDITFDDSIDRTHQDLLEKKLILNFNAAQGRHNSNWRITMNTKMTKLAAAAVILIGVFIGYEMLKETGSVSWAQVRQHVSSARAVIYKASVTGTENGQAFQLSIDAVMAGEYGTRMDAYMGKQLISRSFTLAGEKSYIYLFPEQKKYIEVELTETKRLDNGDPKTMVEAFLKGNYTQLGTREINGVTVEGIKSHEVLPTAGFPGGSGLMGAVEDQSPDNVTAELWVDSVTGWPVEVTLDITDKNGKEQVTIVVSDFQWNAQVDPDTFASVIPEGYSLMYTVNIDQMDSGQQLVDGLRYFASINSGKYPANLSVRDVIGEIGSIYGANSGNSSFQLDDQKIATLKYGAQYFGKLEGEGKEPVYYGSEVTTADSSKVLLRWKLDNGQYRVIFGDLKIEDVDTVKLAELEAK